MKQGHRGPASVVVRTAAAHDAMCLSGLATYVFLDTYASEGMREDLAREAFTTCGAGCFESRVAHDGTEIMLAEANGHAVAFCEVGDSRRCPCPGVDEGVELVRLYVHPRWQRMQLGTRLLREAEHAARRRGAPHLWLTAWAGNTRALAFYASAGYECLGTTLYVFDGHAYENVVLARKIAA